MGPSLSNTCDANFQCSARRQTAAANCISLKAAARYALTKIRANSYLIQAAAFTHRTSGCQYDRRIFVPSILCYAQQIELQRMGLLTAAPTTQSPLLTCPEQDPC